MTANRAYLDHNASAPLLPAARAAMLHALAVEGNPNSVHGEGRTLRVLIDDARRDVAALVGAEPHNVVFTSCATEAASTMLSPRWRMGRAPMRVSRLYVGATEHACIRNGGHFAPDAVEIVPVDRQGMVDIEALGRGLQAHDRGAGTALVAIQAANNETGVLQPVEAIAAVAKAAGAILVVDAVQAAGRIPIAMSEAYADFLILSAHKLGGPKGAGAIVANADLMMPAPLVVGGGQERGHRGGTENVAAIAGFGAAAREALDALPRCAALSAMRDRIEASVVELAPDATIFGAGAARLCNTSCFAVPRMSTETAQIAFDLAGVAVSAGSACSSGKVGGSAVLEAMGFGKGASGLRVSIGHGTGDAEIGMFRSALAGIVSRRDMRVA